MQFRGFRQFGVIGGLGMVLAWLATYVLMPPLLVWLDRGRFSAKPRLQVAELDRRSWRGRSRESRASSRRPRWC